MKRKITLIASLILLILLLVNIETYAEGTYLSRKDLKNDIMVLKEELPSKHYNIAHAITREEFENNLQQLYNQADIMDIDQIFFEMMKAVAAIGDGHTTVNFNKDLYAQFKFLPIKVYCFTDGLFITAAKEDYKDLIGKQIIKVNGMDIKQIFERVKPLIAHENDYWVMEQFPKFFYCYNVLKYLGITTTQTVVLTVDDGRQSHERQLTLMNFQDNLRTFYREFGVSPSIAEKNKNLNYWYEYLEQYHAIYFQYNSCKETPGQTMSEFAKELFARVKKEKVSNLIIDLRNNTGGNSGLFTQEIYPSLRRLPTTVKVFFITGRRTFSSGLFAVRDLTNLKTKTMSFGEPTGNSPNHYGYTGFIKLPNTKISVTFSTRYWDIFPGNHDNTYTPDVLVPIDSGSVFRGEDEVTQRIFEYIEKNQ